MIEINHHLKTKKRSPPLFLTDFFGGGDKPLSFNPEHGPKSLVQYADQLELLMSRPVKVRYIR